MILPQTSQQAEHGTHCKLIVAHSTQTDYWMDTWQNIGKWNLNIGPKEQPNLNSETE